MDSGIYEIVAPSGSRYIGSAVNFTNRWRIHRHLLRRGTHHNKGLMRAASKYGIDGLSFRKILICRVADLIFFEQRAIDVLKPRYNACPTAGSQLGRKHSVASNAKNADWHRGRQVHTAEYRAALAQRMRGNKIMVGRKLSEETKRKVGKASKGRIDPNAFERTVTGLLKQKIAVEYLAGSGLLILERKYHVRHAAIRRILVDQGVAIKPRGGRWQNGQ